MTIRIGPGPSDYGTICTECAGRKQGRQWAHQAWCSELVDYCGRGDHDECHRPDCECVCHPDLTLNERAAVRKMLKEKSNG